MKVVALDPGTTTGIAVFDDYNEGETEWERTQLGPQAHHLQLFDHLCYHDPDIVVCESFIFQPRRKVILDSVEYIGVAKLWCEDEKKPLKLQTPAQGKAFWTDDKIRSLGLWQASRPHAMDATRHLLFYWMQHVDGRFVESLKGD